MPQVSVIIPCYNYGSYLPRAVDSVLSQTFADLEVIVVDDGSTDDTSHVVGGFDDVRVRYHYQQNSGVAEARNAGIRIALGEYFAFLDADDEWLPDKLESQLTLIEKHAKIGLVYGHCLRIGEGDQVVNLLKAEYRGKAIPEILFSNFVSGSASAVLVRRECLERLGGFRQDLVPCEDWHMWVRIANYWEIDYVDGVISRIYDHSLSGGKNINRMSQSLLKMVNLLQKEFPNLTTPHIWQKVWSNACLTAGRWYAFDGNIKKARAEFLESFTYDRSNVCALAFLASTWLGPRMNRILRNTKASLQRSGSRF